MIREKMSFKEFVAKLYFRIVTFVPSSERWEFGRKLKESSHNRAALNIFGLSKT
jgi:hypothetical protein